MSRGKHFMGLGIRFEYQSRICLESCHYLDYRDVRTQPLLVEMLLQLLEMERLGQLLQAIQHQLLTSIDYYHVAQ